LTFPYIRKFGWEEDILQPARGLSPTTVNESTRNTQSQAPSAEAILAQLGLTADVQFAGFRVLSVRPHQRAIVISLLSPESDELKVRLYEPDPARRCYARTNHFDIVHEALPETLVGRTDAPLQALVAHLRTVNFDGRH
jgi:hypothetical protein